MEPTTRAFLSGFAAGLGGLWAGWMAAFGGPVPPASSARSNQARPPISHSRMSAQEALRRDWERIGQDLQKAIERQSPKL